MTSRGTRPVSMRGLKTVVKRLAPARALDMVRGARSRLYRAEQAAFDWRFGVDTRGFVPVEQMDIDPTQKQLGNPYEATPRWVFCRMLRRLGIDYSRYTFIDIGSGKGAVLLYASAFPFKRIVGIEYSARIHAVARLNIERYRAANMRCRDIQTVCADALEYPLPQEPLVVYLYNPFKGELMSKMMQRLEHSLEEAPRSMIVMSCNPIVEVVVDAIPWLERLEKGVNHAIYHNRLLHCA